MSLKIGLCVPTLNAGNSWKEWLAEFLNQNIYLDTALVIDSSSDDKTADLARSAGLSVHEIDKADFNHGATRRQGISMMAGMDIVVFLTQDAILSTPDSISNLISAFENPAVGVAYGRQLPRNNAGAIEQHSRVFNYPEQSRTKSIEDTKELGIKTAFISNSFAAYRISVLNEVGGFPEKVIFGEDMYVATKILQASYKIAYVADACVYHSHDYSLMQEMKRYFDMGVFHAREPWIRQELGGAEGEGARFVVSEFKYLLKHAFWRIPESMLRVLFRYTGFRLGLMEKRLPVWLKRRLVMNKGYFT
ncbi:MAG: glycosyltransferase family 2 protein [Gammaproteobacteria bacterium]|nr:glycosyltransferase family 2 protein [Gammaproteobacteria bacterium]